MNLIKEPSPPAAERQAPVSRAAELRQPDPLATAGVARPRYRRRLQTGVIVALMIAAGIGGTRWWLNAHN